MVFKINQEISACGGKFLKFSHDSKATGTPMDVNIYLPIQYYDVSAMKTIPTIYYLSGLTCTPNNASEKAFWQLQADKYGFAVVFPDTSPRGDDVPSDPNGGWEFGKGAGFYINATESPYSKNYYMYDYVHTELPAALTEFFSSSDKPVGPGSVDFQDNVSITGHSMGGFGSISGFLKNVNRYKSCSAFAAIVDTKNSPWGIKALTGYLGEDKSTWDQYDPCSLIQTVNYVPGKEILIHYGTSDPFLKDQLRPENFTKLAEESSWAGHVNVKFVDGFDHSYYFISSFVPEHAEFHAKHLGLI